MGFQAPSPTLPIIDFTKETLEPGTKFWLSTSEAVLNALEEYGCFVAKYEGVSLGLHNDVLHAMEELFDLPTETKVKNTSEFPFYGYMGQNPQTMHESLGLVNATDPQAIQSFSDIMWPSGNDHFRGTIYSYATLVSELQQTVTKMVFGSYGVDKQYASHASTYWIRFMRYRVPKPHETNCGGLEHTDKSLITVLHQNNVSGLEVQTKAGEWISVQVPPFSCVVMTGDALSAWSNGRLHSPIHRIVMNGKELRYTIGLFSFHNGTIRTPEELIDEEHPEKFKPFNHLELLRDFPGNISLTEYVSKTYCEA